MSLTKNLNIDIKNKHLAIFIISALALGCINQTWLHNVASANQTTINAQVCQGGQQTPNLVSTNPANGAITRTNHLNYVIRTDWASNLTVRLNGTQVFSQNLNYQAGLETIIPINSLLAHPQVNQIEIDIKGGCPESTITRSQTLIFQADILSLSETHTKSRSPELNGDVNNPDLEVRVYIQGRSGFFRAINHRNGKWTLPAGTITPDLEDGVYDIRIESYNTNTSQVVITKSFPRGLTIDNSPPSGGINDDKKDSTSEDRSPEISGKVDDPNAKVKIEINGKEYDAINNGDGTWSLPKGSIDNLANGKYDIKIKIIDQAGNVSESNATININAKNSLGFLIPPNTGYLRIGRTNIPSWLIYLIIIATASGILIKRKQTNKS